MIQAAGVLTKYRGTTFRSRLEARWAHFFDAIGWTWEYEPFDADGYIPDFVIMGRKPLLIEIKPYADLESLRAEGERIKPRLRSVWSQQVAVFGISPAMALGSYVLDRPGISVEGDHGWDDAYPLEWTVCRGTRCHQHSPCGLHDEHCYQLAVYHPIQSWTAIPCAHYDGDQHLEPVLSGQIQELWTPVRDATRWRG